MPDELREDLPTCVRRVLKGLRPVPWAAKGLLLEIFELDLGATGCWLAASDLAVRLGTSESTIEKYLASWERLGILRRVKVERSHTPGWKLRLPRACVPATPRPQPAEVARCVDLLDAWLRARPTTRTGYGVKPEPPTVSPPRDTVMGYGVKPEPLPVSAAALGGPGGAPAAGNGSNSKLPLPLPGTAAGVGANAPERQRERTPGTPKERGWLRRLAESEASAGRLAFTRKETTDE